MMRRYDVKYMPVKNGTILSTRDGFASVFISEIMERIQKLEETVNKIIDVLNGETKQ